MKTNFTPGQIIYSKSDDCWVYISVLRNIQPQNTSGAMQLHTCCDLSIDGDDGSKTMTFARGNGTLLDVDTTFEYVREAYGAERVCLYNALIKAYKDYDLGWDKHFTDSTYNDIRDWLCWEFDVDLDNMDNNNPLGVTIYEITNYIWDTLCKETRNYQACTVYVEPEMVNKDEFIAKVRNWLEKHTYDDKYWTPDGDDLFLGNLIGDICKYLEEYIMLSNISNKDKKKFNIALINSCVVYWYMKNMDNTYDSHMDRINNYLEWLADRPSEKVKYNAMKFVKEFINKYKLTDEFLRNYCSKLEHNNPREKFRSRLWKQK